MNSRRKPFATVTRSRRSFSLPKNTSDQHVDEDDASEHQQLIATKPRRPGVSALDDGVNDSLSLATTPARDAQLGPAGRSPGSSAGGRVDVVLRHPPPILLVELGPLGTKLGAAVAGLHVALLRRILGVRAAARRVPPPRSRGEYSALVRSGGYRAGCHLLRRHEGQ